MKIIQYNLCTKINRGTPEKPEWEDSLSSVKMPWSEEGEAIARREAWGGAYTVEDDGVEETAEPTAQDDTDAMLIDHEYRLTMLELGITE